MIDPINNFLQKKAVDGKFTEVTQKQVLERLQDILEGKVNQKFIGPLPKIKKDLLVSPDIAEQALAIIKINKGHQSSTHMAGSLTNCLRYNYNFQGN